MQKSRAVSLTSRSQIFSVSFQSFFLIIKEEAPEITFLFFWSHYPWAFVTSSLKHPFQTFLYTAETRSSVMQYQLHIGDLYDTAKS